MKEAIIKIQIIGAQMPIYVTGIISDALLNYRAVKTKADPLRAAVFTLETFDDIKYLIDATNDVRDWLYDMGIDAHVTVVNPNTEL